MKEKTKRLMREEITELKELRKQGMTQIELAKKYNTSLGTIGYHTNESVRLKRINYSKSYYRNLPIERKKELNKKKKEYLKNYSKNRYHADKEYRDKILNYQKNRRKDEHRI